MSDEKDIHLNHFGVKGMRWGVHNKAKTSNFDKYDVRRFRQPTKRQQREGYLVTGRQGAAIIRLEKKAQAAREKVARKDPTFQREYELESKGIGLTGKNLRPEVNKQTELFTGKMLGNFKNSKGEKVSVDFANAIIHKRVSKREFKRKVIQGAHLTLAVLIPLSRRPIQKRLANRK